MYIDNIEISNFRVFANAKIDFIHPDRDFRAMNVPRPAIKNVNLIVGDNGHGKTTLLKAIAIAALGPAIDRVKLPYYQLIKKSNNPRQLATTISAEFSPHHQDESIYQTLVSKIGIKRRGRGERVQWIHPDPKRGHPVSNIANQSMFCVGYGATRWVGRTRRTPESTANPENIRARRVRSLFEEAYALRPLAPWLDNLRTSNPHRHQEIKEILNKLLQPTGYRHTGVHTGPHHSYGRGGFPIPFRALSDGLRAFIGWVGDLLYFTHLTCPSERRLIENCGIVMVDEIDLHIHPIWQVDIIERLATALPNLQFIITSHSPLVVGSLERTNLILVKEQGHFNSTVNRCEKAIHGLDADQILVSNVFNLPSTRANKKRGELRELSLRASVGDFEAARRLLVEMSRGSEGTIL